MKHYYLVFLSLLFLFSIHCQAQNDIFKVKATQKGELYLYGQFNGSLTFSDGTKIGEDSTLESSYFLCKMDTIGGVQWVKHIRTGTGSCSGICCPGLGMTTDLNGNVSIAGLFYGVMEVDSVMYTSYNASSNGFILSFNSDGTIRWFKQPKCIMGHMVDIDADSSGNIYVTGGFSNGDFTLDSLPPLKDKSYHDNIFIAKIDSNGKAKWQQQLHGNMPDPFAKSTTNFINCLTTSNIGDTYFAGYFGGESGSKLYFGDYTITNNDDFEIFFGKVDSGGVPVLLNKVNSSKDLDAPEEIVVDSYGDIFLSGLIKEEAQFGNLSPIDGNWMSAFIAKYDPLANVEWTFHGGGKEMPPDYYENRTTGMDLDQFGNLFTNGIFGIEISFDSVFHLNQDKGQGFLVKHDRNGSVKCAVNYPLLFDDLSIDQNGNVYTVSGSPEESDTLTIGKFDYNCNLIRLDYIEHKVTIPPDGFNSYKFDYLQIYPNPVNDILTLKFNDTIQDLCNLRIYNELGQVVKTLDIYNSGLIKLDFHSFHPGFYILEFQIGNQSQHYKVLKM